MHKCVSGCLALESRTIIDMEAQVEFQKNYPDQAAQLNQLARVVF